MAASVNKVFLLGNLTRDPELRYTAGGAALTTLGIAVNRSYTTKDGERRDEVTFVDVTVWNRMAENCAQYLKKGRSVHVEGYLKLDSWDDKDTGKKRTQLQVVADQVQFLGGPRDEAGSSPSSDRDEEAPAPRRSAPPGNGTPRGNHPAPAAPTRRPAPTPEPEADDDDIPF